MLLYQKKLKVIMMIFGLIDMIDNYEYRSLGEIETISKKAARGIGLSWGTSYEFGLCARLICQIGFPGISIIRKNLDFIIQKDISEEIYSSNLGLIKGIKIIDEIEILNFPLEFEVFYPACLIGILLKLKGYKYEISIFWNKLDFHLSSYGIKKKGPFLDTKSLTKVKVDIKKVDKKCDFKCHSNNLILKEDWKRLSDFAALTYVQSSDYSRLHGAGSINDNFNG